MEHQREAPPAVRVSERPAGADAHAEACLAVARLLPDHFTAGAIAQIARDVVDHALYMVEERADGGWVVWGFAVVEHKAPRVAELLWLAVHPDHQRQGCGSALLAAVVESLRAGGVLLLEVKTLAPEVPYAPYVATRRFYERAGFIHLETVDPYPGWDPGSPCAIYVKVLADAAPSSPRQGSAPHC